MVQTVINRLMFPLVQEFNSCIKQMAGDDILTGKRVK